MKIIKRTIINVGVIFGGIYRFTSPLVTKIASWLYTGMIMKKFAKFGHNSVISNKALRLEGCQYIYIGSNSVIREKVQLTAWQINNNNPKISIGNNCCIREGAHISAINYVIIKDHVLTGTNVLISDNSHGTNQRCELDLPPIERKIASKGGIIIEENVWIGNNACILGNVKIGKGAIIGANAVVTHDIPAYSIAVGVPAKVLVKS